MKQIKLFTILVSFLIFSSCNAQDESNTSASNQNASKIEVLDFHSTHRCMTCNAIEANTKYTLQTYFAKEVADGKITFRLINVDEEANEAIAEKFEAFGTALFINVIVNGKETQIELTDFAFMKANEKEEFAQELKIKLDSELKKL